METAEKGVKTRKKRTADAWEALSDRTRREILTMLKHRPHTAGEIADQFELSGATVSHHLSVLRESGFLHSQPCSAFAASIASFTSAARTRTVSCPRG